MCVRWHMPWSTRQLSHPCLTVGSVTVTSWPLWKGVSGAVAFCNRPVRRETDWVLTAIAVIFQQLSSSHSPFSRPVFALSPSWPPFKDLPKTEQEQWGEDKKKEEKKRKRDRALDSENENGAKCKWGVEKKRKKATWGGSEGADATIEATCDAPVLSPIPLNFFFPSPVLWMCYILPFLLSHSRHLSTSHQPLPLSPHLAALLKLPLPPPPPPAQTPPTPLYCRCPVSLPCCLLSGRGEIRPLSCRARALTWRFNA